MDPKTAIAAGLTSAVQVAPSDGETITPALDEAEGHVFEGTPLPHARQRTILLIEDDFVTRRIMAEILGEEGYKVICAANGAEAVGLVQSSFIRPFLIILDIWMPYMDGLEFRAFQRTLPSARDIPVVVVSAGGFRPEEAEGLGFSRVLRKPFHEADLLQAVREFAV
jgi:CheY-like chemotaxis protein